MEREIILDTETTGLDPFSGHRIVEIGCVELVNRIPTGHTFHKYVNPERDVPAESYAIHGLSAEFLSDKPKFAEVTQELIDFIGDSKIVIHNAEFDTRFVNHHLNQLGLSPLDAKNVFCTLIYARKKYPGQQNSLDALCRRFNIDNSKRVKHGALLDAEILAEVYVELMGGKQNTINLEQKAAAKVKVEEEVATAQVFKLRDFQVSPEELEKHKTLVAGIKNSLWSKISEENSN